MAYFSNSISLVWLRAGTTDEGRVMMRPMPRHSGVITSRECGMGCKLTDAKTQMFFPMDSHVCLYVLIRLSHGLYYKPSLLVVLIWIDTFLQLSDWCSTSAHLHKMISQHEPSRWVTSLSVSCFPDTPSAAELLQTPQTMHAIRGASLLGGAPRKEFFCIIHGLCRCD